MICFILFVIFLAVNSFWVTIRQNSKMKALIAVSIVVTFLVANLTEATLVF